MERYELEFSGKGQYKHVFSPFKFGNIEVKNRIESAPISCLATPDGFVRREMIDFYKSFAMGGAGIVTIGDAVVDYDYAKGHHGQLNLSDDRVIMGLSTIVEAIQKYGAKASIEINHAGRWAWKNILNGKDPIGPSPIPSRAEEELAEIEGRRAVHVQEMNQDMIDQVIDNFACACYRCMVAGFEMVMVHGGHGHLLSQFVSPYSNKRTDGYGGSLENRAKFVIEILKAVRRKVGNRLAIEYRISGDELVPGGMHLDENIEFLKMIEDKIDLVHVSVGLLIDPTYSPHHMPPTYLPYAYNANRAEKIKKALRIPVACVGSIIDLQMAEQIIAEGKADIVAMARAMVADHEIVNKTRRGELDDITPCIRCNVCLDSVRKTSMNLCAVNPVSGREGEYRHIRPAEKKKNVVIIGGGPAGMEAAQIASSRGHQVTLYEKEKELGGALRAAAGPSFKTDMNRYLNWMIKKTLQLPMEVKMSTEVTADIIKAAKPDVLILAVGAEPVNPDIPGFRKPNVVWAPDVDLGKVKTGENIVVAGAGLTGCETALHLAQQKKNVTVIDMIAEPEIAHDATGLNRITLLELMRQHTIKFRTEVKLEEITDRSVIVINRQWNRHEIPADTVVLALGVKSRYDIMKGLQGLARDVYVIGDCLSPRNLMAAIHDAFNVSVEI